MRKQQQVENKEEAASAAEVWDKATRVDGQGGRQVGGTSGNVGAGCCSGPRPSPRPRASRQQHTLPADLHTKSTQKGKWPLKQLSRRA